MATNYMNLVLPVVGPNGTPGPNWAELLNQALDQIDQHDHSNGKGKQITPSGININQALEMNGNRLTEVLAVALQDNSTSPNDSSLVYEFGGELFFNDLSGNKVQLTSNGQINVASLGTITGDYSTSTADLTYSDASKTFIFKQSATATASVDHGPMKIYRNVASSHYTLFQLSGSQSGNITLTLLASLPASTLPMKVSSAGVLEATQIVAADIASDAVTTAKILDANVTAAKLATDSVTTGKIADGNVTRPKLASVGQQISASSGNFTTTSNTLVDVTNMSVTITTTGRPVMVMVMPAAPLVGIFQANGINTGGLDYGPQMAWSVERGGTVVGGSGMILYQISGAQLAELTIPGVFSVLDPVAAGTYTYKFRVFSPATGPIKVQNCVLVAYEL